MQERRLRLLDRVPALAGLLHAERASLAGALAEERIEPGQVELVEGDEADRLYPVAEGRLEVSLTGPDGPIRVAILDVGDIVGEMALLSSNARRSATVRALTRGCLLSLPAPVFQSLLEAHPGPRAAFTGRAELASTAHFLKLASPFGALAPAALQSLARPAGGAGAGRGRAAGAGMQPAARDDRRRLAE